MLIVCEECGAKISSKASICVYCGCPVPGKTVPTRTKKKRPRLPNGFGQITEIKGKNLRKPFRAMITVGKTEYGRPICKILKPEGYFATYGEAYAALIKYNLNPYDLEKEMTMQELYDRWKEDHLKTIKPQSAARIPAAWKYCHSIYNVKVREVRPRHIKACVEEGYVLVDGEKKYAKNSVKLNIKNILNMMLDYAVEYEIVDKNCARDIKMAKTINKEIEENKRNHISFAESEMQKLWDNKDYEPANLILIQSYMGLRPRELAGIKTENVDMDKNIIICGMKTAAGENRTVPIHECIRDMVEAWYKKAVNLGSEYLINVQTRQNRPPKPMDYHIYKARFDKALKDLDLNPLHRPHDPRKQFATMAKKYNLDEYALKMIMGHAITDITERIYTDRDIEWLHEEMQKIRVPYIETSV